MTKVVICSSMRNQATVWKIAEQIRYLHDNDVVTPLDVPFNNTTLPREKSANRRFYFKVIDIADIVVFYTKNHIGIGTAIELGYALAKKKNIVFTHRPPAYGTTSRDITQKWDEITALIEDRTVKLLEYIYPSVKVI